MLVVLAFFISIPVAWYAMHYWLQTFAYRINLEWWVFALAGFLAQFIATLAIVYQSVKASLMNPVESLRSE
jgi:putative ABC transport system permease protein